MEALNGAGCKDGRSVFPVIAGMPRRHTGLAG